MTVSFAKAKWDQFRSNTHACNQCCVRATDTSEIDASVPTQYIHDESSAASPQMKHAMVFQADVGDKDLVDRGDVVVEGSARYKGQWKGIYFHGQGTLSRPDGSWYEGQFDQGRAHGHGKFVAQNGNSYEGQWFQDGAHGFGRYIFEDGSIYEGEWRGDEKSGEGMERWSDGSHYIGQFLKGHKHGFGFYTSSTGDPLFRGQFQADKMDGEGTYYFANGRTYVGQWKDGHMNGQGTMQWPDGSKYKGGYQDDLRHGEGDLTWPDGRAYTGQWCKGKQDGIGFVVEPSGEKRASQWVEGLEVAEAVAGKLRSVDEIQKQIEATSAGEKPSKPEPFEEAIGSASIGPRGGSASIIPQALDNPKPKLNFFGRVDQAKTKPEPYGARMDKPEPLSRDCSPAHSRQTSVGVPPLPWAAGASAALGQLGASSLEESAPDADVEADATQDEARESQPVPEGHSAAPVEDSSNFNIASDSATLMIQPIGVLL